MTNRWKKLPLAIALASVATVTAVAAVQVHREPPAASAPAAGQPPGPHAASELAVAGRTAMGLLGAAQSELESSHANEAKHHLQNAQEVLTQMAHAMQQGSEPSLGSVPIFAQVIATGTQDVLEQARAQVDPLGPLSLSGQHDKVVEGLRATGLELTYTYVELPVADTLGQVESALKALEAGDSTGAASALAAAAEGLKVETVEIGAAATTEPAGPQS